MDDDRRDDDDFVNLLAAYIESSDRERLRRESPPALFDVVVEHVRSCPECQDHCRKLAARAAFGRTPE